MDLFSKFEKLLTEHASAAVLRDHLALLKEQRGQLENDNAKLGKRVKELEALCADLTAQLAKKAKHRKEPDQSTTHLVTGELIVDKIVWRYSANSKTGKWNRFTPLCPHCRTQLCVEDTSNLFALSDQDRSIRIYCDMDDCQKFSAAFQGTLRDREDKVARHALRKLEGTSQG